MTKRDWSSVLLKIVGVVLVIGYLSALFVVTGLLLAMVSQDDYYPSHKGGGDNILPLVFYVGTVVCGIVLGVLLVTHSDRLADRLLKTTPAMPPPPSNAASSGSH